MDKGNANAIVRSRVLRQVVYDLRKVPLVSRVRGSDLIVGKDAEVVAAV